jgi:hypothetical protein
MEAYARSPWGEKQWRLHKHADVDLFRADTQWELTPLQTEFLFHAGDEHEPDPDNTDTEDAIGTEVPNAPRTHTQTESIF